ncbi:hypothetical protein J6590_003407 [Homalodisca vitripennis]|nr:hypothetical protein J6590_003407 [Homalodisca vitripennis]
MPASLVPYLKPIKEAQLSFVLEGFGMLDSRPRLPQVAAELCIVRANAYHSPYITNGRAVWDTIILQEPRSLDGKYSHQPDVYTHSYIFVTA